MKNGDKNITYNIGSKNTLKEYIYLLMLMQGKHYIFSNLVYILIKLFN